MDARLKLLLWHIAQHRRNAEAFDDSGWVPHYTMPVDCVEKCGGDTDAIHGLLSRHYQERWPEVRQAIESRLERYDIDNEAKKAFCEALHHHQDGRYQSVCRLLMLEIERVSRMELHDNSVKTITGQNDLRKLAGKFPLSLVNPAGFFDLNLFKKLSSHLYEHINDEADRQRFEQDPVPNRHAVVHGYVTYDSMQSSLNMIFMADYIFQTIVSLKKGEREL